MSDTEEHCFVWQKRLVFELDFKDESITAAYGPSFQAMVIKYRHDLGNGLPIERATTERKVATATIPLYRL